MASHSVLHDLSGSVHRQFVVELYILRHRETRHSVARTRATTLAQHPAQRRDRTIDETVATPTDKPTAHANTPTTRCRSHPPETNATSCRTPAVNANTANANAAILSAFIAPLSRKQKQAPDSQTAVCYFLLPLRRLCSAAWRLCAVRPAPTTVSAEPPSSGQGRTRPRGCWSPMVPGTGPQAESGRGRSPTSSPPTSAPSSRDTSH